MAAQARVLDSAEVRAAATGEPIGADTVLAMFWKEKRRALHRMQEVFILGLGLKWDDQSTRD